MANSRPRYAPLVGKPLALTICAAILVLAFSSPSPAARVAVLTYGGLEKTAIRHVLWPVMDRDGDGSPSGPWGTDCDDGDAQVHPLGSPPTSRYLGCRRVAVGRVADQVVNRDIARANTGSNRGVVLVVVDTLRKDALEASDAGFGDFRHFENYKSCGSETRHVLAQLLGAEGCPSSRRWGPIAARFRDAGFATAMFSEYGPDDIRMPQSLRTRVYGGFEDMEVVKSPQQVLQKAGVWINEHAAQSKPFFTFVHLVGGHAPYSAAGATSLQRYSNQVRNALLLVGKFARSLPDETSVVVLGDHGEEFGEHDGYQHAQTLYEEVLATPLLLKGPSVVPGIDARDLGCADLGAWLARFTEGTTTLPSPGLPRAASLDVPAGTIGGLASTYVRAMYLPGGYKIIWRPDVDVWELYDLTDDPAERRNLASIDSRVFNTSADALLNLQQVCYAQAAD